MKVFQKTDEASTSSWHIHQHQRWLQCKIMIPRFRKCHQKTDKASAASWHIHQHDSTHNCKHRDSTVTHTRRVHKDSNQQVCLELKYQWHTSTLVSLIFKTGCQCFFFQFFQWGTWYTWRKICFVVFAMPRFSCVFFSLVNSWREGLGILDGDFFVWYCQCLAG